MIITIAGYVVGTLYVLAVARQTMAATKVKKDSLTSGLIPPPTGYSPSSTIGSKSSIAKRFNSKSKNSSIGFGSLLGRKKKYSVVCSMLLACGLQSEISSTPFTDNWRGSFQSDISLISRDSLADTRGFGMLTLREDSLRKSQSKKKVRTSFRKRAEKAKDKNVAASEDHSESTLNDKVLAANDVASDEGYDTIEGALKTIDDAIEGHDKGEHDDSVNNTISNASNLSPSEVTFSLGYVETPKEQNGSATNSFTVVAEVFTEDTESTSTAL